MVLRVVATDSATTNDGHSLVVDIPPIPSLPGPPTDTSVSNNTELNAAWVKQRGIVRDARREAHAAAMAGAERLRRFPLDKTGQSGVTACASALALLVGELSKRIPDPKETSFLIASDLADNRPTQLRGNFDGAPVVVVQTCPSGVISRCDGLFSTFSSQIKGLGAGEVSSVRSELADRTLAQWLEH